MHTHGFSLDMCPISENIIESSQIKGLTLQWVCLLSSEKVEEDQSEIVLIMIAWMPTNWVMMNIWRGQHQPASGVKEVERLSCKSYHCRRQVRYRYCINEGDVPPVPEKRMGLTGWNSVTKGIKYGLGKVDGARETM